MKAIIYPERKCCAQSVKYDAAVRNPSFDYIKVENEEYDAPTVYLCFESESGEYKDSYCQANLSPEEAMIVGHSLIRAAKLLQNKE